MIVVKKILFIIAGLTVALAARAQSDVQFSDFTRLKYYYNPGASGTDGLLNVAAAYSMQFVGFDDAPKTLYVGADIPVYFLNSHHGAGINLFSDDFGMFNQSVEEDKTRHWRTVRHDAGENRPERRRA